MNNNIYVYKTFCPDSLIQSLTESLVIVQTLRARRLKFVHSVAATI